MNIEQLLSRLTSGGEVPTRDVIRAGLEVGVPERTMRRRWAALGYQVTRRGFGPQQRSFLVPPERRPRDPYYGQWPDYQPVHCIAGDHVAGMYQDPPSPTVEECAACYYSRNKPQ